jgi:twinkle protein
LSSMCGSSDGRVINDDDSSYCFSCGTFWSSETLSEFEPTKASIPLSKEQEAIQIGGYHAALDLKGHPLADRRISKQTCEFFDVKVNDGADVTIASIVLPYYKGGELIAQKIRTVESPKGFWKGDAKGCDLFGANKFTSGDKITITEGEMDCLAYRDLMGDYPVCSIKNGAQSAVKDIRKNLHYFDNFNHIYICFDNDEPGRKAAQEVAEIFPIGKAKIVNLRHFKDANDYLKANKPNEFKKCWWDAEPFTPAGIVFGTSLLERIKKKLNDRKAQNGVVYPFDKLNEYTYGIRTGEMVTLVSGTGMGKSSILAEVMHHLLTSTTQKIGVMMLEESVEMANLRLMSIQANKPLHLPDTEYSDEELKTYADATIHLTDTEGDPRVISFDHFGSNSVDTIISKVDYMAALGCKYIFLDHISILVSDQSSGDERKALDEIATKLRTKVQERDICLFLVSHLRRPGGKPHEEGGETSLADIRGTAGIGQLSDIVLGFERNQQHPDEYLRSITKIRVLKNRFCGMTGLTSYVAYDKNTGRIEEVDPEEVEALENHNSKEGKEFRVEDNVFDNTEFAEDPLSGVAA